MINKAAIGYYNFVKPKPKVKIQLNRNKQKTLPEKMNNHQFLFSQIIMKQKTLNYEDLNISKVKKPETRTSKIMKESMLIEKDKNLSRRSIQIMNTTSNIPRFLGSTISKFK